MTQLVLAVLEHKRRENIVGWESGNTLSAGTTAQLCLNAAAIGENKAYAFLTELTLDQLKGEVESADGADE